MIFLLLPLGALALILVVLIVWHTVGVVVTVGRWAMHPSRHDLLQELGVEAKTCPECSRSSTSMRNWMWKDCPRCAVAHCATCSKRWESRFCHACVALLAPQRLQYSSTDPLAIALRNLGYPISPTEGGPREGRFSQPNGLPVGRWIFEFEVLHERWTGFLKHHAETDLQLELRWESGKPLFSGRGSRTGDEQFDREFRVQQRGTQQPVFADARLRRWASRTIRAGDSLILRRRGVRLHQSPWSEFRLEVHGWPTPEDIVEAAEAVGLILRSQGDRSIERTHRGPASHTTARV